MPKRTKTYGLESEPVTQGAAWTMYSMRGRAGAEGLGRGPSAPPPAARVARPRTSLLRINFAASNALYKEQTAWLADKRRAT